MYWCIWAYVHRCFGVCAHAGYSTDFNFFKKKEKQYFKRECDKWFRLLFKSVTNEGYNIFRISVTFQIVTIIPTAEDLCNDVHVSWSGGVLYP